MTFRIADAFGNVGTATADVFMTDLRSGDLFVGVQPSASTIFGVQTKGAVQRIRGGSVSDFCQSRDPVTFPLQPGDPVFWRRPDQIVVDAKGPGGFLAPLSSGNPSNPAPPRMAGDSCAAIFPGSHPSSLPSSLGELHGPGLAPCLSREELSMAHSPSLACTCGKPNTSRSRATEMRESSRKRNTFLLFRRTGGFFCFVRVVDVSAA